MMPFDVVRSVCSPSWVSPLAFVDLDALGATSGGWSRSPRRAASGCASPSSRSAAWTHAAALAARPEVARWTFTLAESLWLAGQGLPPVVAYPTASRGDLAALDRLDAELPVLMVDSRVSTSS